MEHSLSLHSCTNFHFFSNYVGSDSLGLSILPCQKHIDVKRKIKKTLGESLSHRNKRSSFLRLDGVQDYNISPARSLTLRSLTYRTPLDVVAIRRDHNLHLLYFDPSNQGTIDRLIVDAPEIERKRECTRIISNCRRDDREVLLAKKGQKALSTFSKPSCWDEIMALRRWLKLYLFI